MTTKVNNKMSQSENKAQKHVTDARENVRDCKSRLGLVLHLIDWVSGLRFYKPIKIKSNFRVTLDTHEFKLRN